MRRLIRSGALALALLASWSGPASAQTYTPQSASPLTVTFQVERLGGSRVLIFGEVRNASGTTYDRVVLLAEGLDDTGRVVSRARAYVTGGAGRAGDPRSRCGSCPRAPSGASGSRWSPSSAWTADRMPRPGPEPCANRAAATPRLARGPASADEPAPGSPRGLTAGAMAGADQRVREAGPTGEERSI